jgi:hypothetical protein
MTVKNLSKMSDIEVISAKLDDFISKTNPTKTVGEFYISIADLIDGKEVYNKMQARSEPSYNIFGSDGYSSYSLYKSSAEKIYLCEIDCQSPSKYIEITSANMLYTE